MFQKELNPPVIQVIQPIPEPIEIDTEEPSAPPITPALPVIQKSLNPFLNVDEIMEEVSNQGSESMLVDDSVTPGKETNPFRRLSGEPESQRTVTLDQEMKTEKNDVDDEDMNKIVQDEEMES